MNTMIIIRGKNNCGPNRTNIYRDSVSPFNLIHMRVSGEEIHRLDENVAPVHSRAFLPTTEKDGRVIRLVLPEQHIHLNYRLLTRRKTFDCDAIIQ